jgi:hypothetical protein
MNNIDAPRPLNLGEILDRTVQMYRERFLVYLGIAIIPTGVVVAFAGIIFLVLAWFGVLSGNGANTGFENPAIGVVVVLLVGVLSLLAVLLLLGVSSLSTAAINHAVAGTLAGGLPTIRGSFAEAWRRGWMYVGLYILQALIVWIAPLIVWFVGMFLLTLLVGAAGGGGAPGQAAGALVGLLTLFGLAAVGGYALWMLLCTSFSFPVCVVEKIGAGDALMRSFRLSKGTRGRIFVLYLLGYVLGMVVSMVGFLILVIVIALNPKLSSPQNSQMLGMIMMFTLYGLSFAVQTLTKPVYGIALMLFYYDQRIRNEGYDIEWMMERAGMVGGGAIAAASAELRPGPTEIETDTRDEGFGGARTLVPAETTEKFVAPEAAEATETTQPRDLEIGVEE